MLLFFFYIECQPTLTQMLGNDNNVNSDEISDQNDEENLSDSNDNNADETHDESDCEGSSEDT